MPPEVEEAAAAEAVEITPEILESDQFKDILAKAVTKATEPLQTSIGNLEKTNKDIKAEKQTLAGKLSEFEEREEQLKQKLDEEEDRKLAEAGEHDKLREKEQAKQREKDRAQMEAEYGSKLEQSVAQIESVNKELEDEKALSSQLKKTLIESVRDEGISQAFVASGADNTQLRSVRAIAKDTVLVAGEYKPVVSVDNNGVAEFRHSTTGEILQNSTGDFGFSNWLVHLSEKEELPLYAKPKGHGNPNAISKANPKGYTKSQLMDNPKLKADFKRENGIAAYDALPFD